MTDQPPEPPASLPAGVAEVLDDSNPPELLAAARYAETLAEYRRDTTSGSGDAARSESMPESAQDQGEPPGQGSAERQGRDYGTSQASNRARENDGARNRPTDVPSNASVTVKTINGNRYRYWQWRDGEKIRSKYIEPVGADE